MIEVTAGSVFDRGCSVGVTCVGEMQVFFLWNKKNHSQKLTEEYICLKVTCGSYLEGSAEGKAVG